MMQNFTLPTSQTLALGATLNSIDTIKNSTNIDKSNISEPSTSFEMMLKKQVKAHKQTMQDKTAQENSAHKNTTHKHLIDQKKAQLKAEQNEQTNKAQLQNNQNADEVDNHVAMAQMLDDAKALFANSEPEKKVDILTEKSTGDGTSGYAQNQALLQDTSSLAIAPNITPATQILPTIKNHDVSLVNTISASNSAQAKVVLLPQANTSNTLNIEETKQNLEGKDLPKNLAQDQLQWASVSTAKSGQTSELANNQVLTNASNDAAINKLDSAKLSDTVSSLNIAPHQQSHAAQAGSMLQAHQVGTSNQINAYPGKTGWDQAISQKVVWMVGAAEQTATLSLNPPDLGPLQVVISVRNDMVDTTFTSNNAEVRQALQDGITNLREKMAESGIQLGQANVNSGGRPQQEFQQSLLNQQSTKFSDADSGSSTPLTVQTTKIGQINNGLVDTFA